MILTQRALLPVGLALLLAGGWPTPGCRPASAAERPRPGVMVQATYPGAGAQVVAETVAVPIEQQVNGVEKMLCMRSQCRDDGSYTLVVTFDHGVDLEMAQVLVQNRVSLALPVLPEAVKRAGGVTVKKQPAGVLLLCCLSSPDGSRDSLYLSNYATIQLRDELARLPGVGDVALLGGHDYAMRLLLSPESMAARNLTCGDVVRALEAQQAQVKGRIGKASPAKEPSSPIVAQTLGRLADAEQFENIILKTDAEGRVIRLKDVARIELGGGEQQIGAFRGGQPVVALAVYVLWQARVRELDAAVPDAVSRLRAALPQGLALDVPFDFTANLDAPARPTNPEYLLLDLALPSGASAERASRVLRRCEAALRKVEGVQDALLLPNNPFDQFRNTPCILVRLLPADKRSGGRERVIEAVRTRLAQVEEIVIGLRDLSGSNRLPDCAYPVDLAVYGPHEDKVRQWAGKVAGRLRQSKKLTDVWIGPELAPRAQVYLDIARTMAKTMGIAIGDVFDTLQVAMGSLQVGNFSQYGRTWQVLVQADAHGRDKVEDIRRFQVRNAKGDMVPLSRLVTVRRSEAAGVVDRFNLWPSVEITANLAPGKSLAEVRALCETLAEEARKELGLPDGYRVIPR